MVNPMNKKEYEEDLARRQKEHLDSIAAREEELWQPCMHDSCPDCVGTGIKRDGSICVHYISCDCRKCRPTFSYSSVSWQVL